MWRVTTTLTVLAALTGAAGCADTPKAQVVNLATFDANDLDPNDLDPNDLDPPATISLETYTFDVGDIMDIKFFYYPELNETVTVRPDGRISLQLVGDVLAQGLTPMTLHDELTKRYEGRLRDPHVAVIVKEFTSQRVYVGGEVNTPRSVPCVGRITTLQAIMEAGGFKDSAELKSVVVLRDQGTDTPAFLCVNLKEDLDQATLHNDMELKPRDIIFVPKSKIAKLNQFVDQHVKQLIPMMLSFNLGYNLNPEVQVR